MIARARPTLRDYQVDLVDRVRACIASGLRRVVLVAVTGAGKTVMGSEMIECAVARRRRALFLAHRTELIEQAAAKLSAVGVDCGILQGGQRGDPLASVQVASVATLANRLRRRRPSAAAAGWDLGHQPSALDAFDLIIVDECHHATAAGYRAVFESYPRAAVVGLTATPYRLDGSGLGDVFQAIEAGPQIADLIRLGYLVPPVVYAPPPPSELAQMRINGKTLVLAERVLDQTAPIAEIVASWRCRAAGRTTVGFACSVEHAEHCAAAFRAAGVPSAAIDGGTPERDRARALAALASGELRVLWNCMLLTEGWDLPACSAVILARPTDSRGLWRQMIGRGLRTWAGKRDCVVLDHVGSVYRFGMPEEPDEYSLESAPKRRRGPRFDAATVCPHCDVVVPDEAPCCARCGWVVPLQAAERADRTIDERRAVALRPAEALSEDARRRIYQALLEKAVERRYASGWAAHRFKERFGRFPQRAWFAPYEGMFS